MATTDGILEYARWVEEIAPGFIALIILAERGEDYRDRDFLDQVACLIEIFASLERHRSSGVLNCPLARNSALAATAGFRRRA
jgi:hypothetical protein